MPKDNPPTINLHHLTFWYPTYDITYTKVPHNAAVEYLKRILWEESKRIRKYGEGLDHTALRIWKVSSSSFSTCHVTARLNVVDFNGWMSKWLMSLWKTLFDNAKLLYRGTVLNR